jgi:hypothetical protein
MQLPVLGRVRVGGLSWGGLHPARQHRPSARAVKGSKTIDTSIRDAVTGLREHGYSRAEIGSRLGVIRQAAQQRWGNRS